MSELLRLGVMISGGGTNLQSILEACAAGATGATVAAVISNRASAYGLERARQASVPAYHVPVGPTGSDQWAAADARHVEIMHDHGVGLVCLAGYMRKNGPLLLAAYANAVMNIHPALLPAFPGVDVQQAALDYGVRFSGCTVHFADAEFDRGPIIIQAVVPTLPDDDAEALGHRILEQEHRIYPQAIRWFAAGRLAVHGRRVEVCNAPSPLSEANCLISPGLD